MINIHMWVWKKISKSFRNLSTQRKIWVRFGLGKHLHTTLLKTKRLIDLMKDWGPTFQEILWKSRFEKFLSKKKNNRGIWTFLFPFVFAINTHKDVQRVFMQGFCKKFLTTGSCVFEIIDEILWNQRYFSISRKISDSDFGLLLGWGTWYRAE